MLSLMRLRFLQPSALRGDAISPAPYGCAASCRVGELRTRNNVPRRAQNAVASHTHTFTPNLLNELRLGFNRIAAGVFQQNMANNLNLQVGLPSISSNPRDSGLSQISINGYSTLGDEPHNPQHSATSIYQVSDAVTWARGKHLVRAGVDLRWPVSYTHLTLPTILRV